MRRFAFVNSRALIVGSFLTVMMTASITQSVITYQKQSESIQGFLLSIEDDPAMLPEEEWDEEEEAAAVNYERWATYFRDGIAQEYSANCGNGLCEPFESCKPTSCADGKCTEDCGGLYCLDDCKKKEDD
tara:strand:- start:543 stop:932 length:390 start_codon:yes stop_codon:yes gene_type:complete